MATMSSPNNLIVKNSDPSLDKSTFDGVENIVVSSNGTALSTPPTSSHKYISDSNSLSEPSEVDSSSPARGPAGATLGTKRSLRIMKHQDSSTFDGAGTTTAANKSHSSVEALINYLSAHGEKLTTDKYNLKKFEEITMEVLVNTHDPELHRIFKSYGWFGSRYRASEENPLEVQSFVQALSNWYLKHKVTSYTSHISNLFGLGDSKGADQILSFCPDLLLNVLMEDDQEENTTNSYSFKGACMLADISGFSKFSGAMCSKGVSGLDDLREATNGFLGHIVKVVYEFEGDVIAFAGDALICVFPETKNSSEEHKESDADDTVDPESPDSVVNSPEKAAMLEHAAGGKSDCCFRALECACVIRNYTTANLSAHLGVTYGDMKLALLGGLHDQWVFLLNGPCVSELSGCIDDAGSKEVVCSKLCYQHAMATIGQKNFPKYNKAFLEITDCKEGSTNVKIQQIGFAVDIERTMMRVNSSRSGVRKTTTRLKRQSSRTISVGKTSEQSLIESAALFVPRPVLTAVYSESLDHIGELRQVTTMFLSLDSYSPTLHQDPLSLQPFFEIVQQILYDSGGFLRQFLVDDKGCVVIAMWGIPSFTYSNNCSRALFCSVSTLKKIETINHRCSVGVTTGNVFCGSVGALERRDYVGIGNEVNMAARLMSKAKGRVLIDNNTFVNLNQGTQEMLSPAESMKLKGIENPVVPHAFTGTSIPRVAAVDEQPGYHVVMRKQVKAVLGMQLDKITNKISKNTIRVGGGSFSARRPSFSRDTPGAATAQELAAALSTPSEEPGNKLLEQQSIATTVPEDNINNVYFTLIMGPAGTGKTTAAEYYKHWARKRNIQCVFIQSRPGHDGVPYGLIREFFLELVGDDNFTTESQQRKVISTLVDMAYPEDDDVQRAVAQHSVELVLGVEWSEIYAANARKGGKSSSHGGASGLSSGSTRDVSNDPRLHSIASLPSSNKSADSAGSSGTNDGEESSLRGANGSSKISNRNNLAAVSLDCVKDNGRSNAGSSSGTLTLTRKAGDLSFYNVMKVLLKNTPTAVVIEDAHFCDELSWNEFHLLLSNKEEKKMLNLSVLITMRSNTVQKVQSGGSFINTDSGNVMNNNGPTGGPIIEARNSFGFNNSVSPNNTMDSPMSAGGASERVNNGSQNLRKMSLLASSAQMVALQTGIEGDGPTTNAGTRLPPLALQGSLKHPTSLASESRDSPGIPQNSRFLAVPSCIQIMEHENSSVIEMSGLNEEEVRDVLLTTLKVSNVSNDLIRLVLNVSSGNAFWCKSIAHFIKERGVEELEKAIKQGDSRQNSLKVLILIRMERLSLEHQLVLKHCSIMGDEFSEKMLLTVLPPKLSANLTETMEELSGHGFILNIEEYPLVVFGFQNQLIQNTLYDLMPPSDAAQIHLKVAEFIEAEYSKNLRPFYPMLGHHYKKCLVRRALAFKFQVKAADQAISRGAYNDGLVFVNNAVPLAVSKPELKVLLEVINRGLVDITQSVKATQTQFRRLSRSFSPNEQVGNRIASYMNLKLSTEAALEKLTKGSAPSIKEEPGRKSNKSPGPGGAPMLSNRQPSARLNWQPSYVASRKLADDDDEEKNKFSKCSSAVCTIS